MRQKSKQTTYVQNVAIPAAILSIFTLDILTPMNVMVPFFYVFVPFLHPREGDRWFLWVSAATCIVLTILTVVVGLPATAGSPHWVFLTNRTIAIFAIFGVTLATNKRLKSEDALNQAIRQRDEFFAVLAHELRNPVAAIHNGIEVIKKTCIQRDGPGQLGTITDMMDRQSKSLVYLIDEILEISRYNTGKIQLIRRPVNISSALKSAVEANQPLIESRQHDLNVSLEANIPVLDADLLRLSQAFTNLLNNAAKFTEVGGKINLSAKNKGEIIEVIISDSGSGIAPEVLPGIFDLYAQAENSEERGLGLGIGLALVKEIIKAHGGTVEAQSEGLGKGSKFVVRLPISEG